MEKTDDKKEITNRFVVAVNYLLDMHKIKAYRDLEKIDIKAQRVTDFKTSMADDTRNSYVSPVEIKRLHDHYGISYDYIMNGIKPICPGSEKEQETRSDHIFSDNLPPRPGYGKSDIEKRVELLEKKFEAHQLEISILKDRVG